MKRICAAFFILVSTALLAQAQQSGIAAKMTAANGKEFPVFLQGVEQENIVFQLYKKTNNQTVPARLITKLEFVGQFDADGAEGLFNTGDYQGMIEKMEADLQPSLDAYWPFMSVENNLEDLFIKLMKAYLRQGNAPKAGEAAAILLQNPSASVKGQAESIAILAALRNDRVAAAEAMVESIESAPGKLYLNACVFQAKSKPVEAIKLITELIKQYANDLDWMPQAELLNVQLYLDMGLTNSAIRTAQQVQNIYANSDVGNDAAKMHEEISLAKQRAEEAMAARAAEEEAERASVRERAKERAKGYGFNITEESESAESVSGDQENTQ
jgi:hypothetical protein